MAKYLTLDQCGEARHLRNIEAGRYSIEYHDTTHLAENQWVHLGFVDLEDIPIAHLGDEMEQFFSFTKSISGLPAPGNGSQNAERIIEDTVALALGRLGLATPRLTRELREELVALNQEEGIVVVPDTNALHNGALHWLLRAINGPSVWILPVVASLTTVQSRDATVKGLVNKRKPNNLSSALRSRGLVNGALGLLQRNRGRSQVVEIDPSLLRYQKMGSDRGSDPDQSDVLEDRLIIEAIHSVLRTMRSRTARRVVTSDVNIARVLDAEGIATLFIPTITLGNSAIPCLRYDALGRTFVGAPLRALLWEFTHAFSSIRLFRDSRSRAQFDCYWPGKTPAEWSAEVLLCEFEAESKPPHPPAGDQPPSSPSVESDTPVAPSAGRDPAPVEGAPPASAPVATVAAGQSRQAAPAKTVDAPTRQTATRGAPSVGGKPKPAMPTRQSSDKATGGQREAKPVAPANNPRVAEINAVLPRASLPQMLRMLASLRRLGAGTAEQIVDGLREDKITVPNARRGLEVLRRIRLLEQDGTIFRPTAEVGAIDSALRQGDLDHVSEVMTRFMPYERFLATLRERGRIERSEVVELVKNVIGVAGSDESSRLPRFHTLLGQAWTQGGAILDGSQRPTDRDATDAFESAFAATAAVGIARVSELLPRFCEMTRMSPWAAKGRLQKFVADRMLPHYTFQPAAGGKPIARDDILQGPLDSFVLEPVAVDRLHLGQRPVFTIEGPAR